MGEFKEIFKAYGGDYETTIARFMNSEQSYLRFLEMFFADDSFSKLGEALEAGDLKAAFEAAHTLKGVSGNMGLTPLYDSVCAIVAPLRIKAESADYASLYQAVRAEFQRAEELKNSLKGGGTE